MEFLKLRLSFLSSSSYLLRCFPCPPVKRHCRRRSGPVRPPPASLPPHVAPPQTPGPTSPRDGASSPRHAIPSGLRGRHLAVAVASSLHSPGPHSPARLSTTNSPATRSLHSFADSPTLDPGHHRRHPQNAGELKPPSNRASTATPPAPTPPLALPRLREANRPLLLAQSPL